MLNAFDNDSSSDEDDPSFATETSSPALLSFVDKNTRSELPYWKLPPVSERFKMVIGNRRSPTQTEGRSRTEDWLDEIMTHRHPACDFECKVNGSPGTAECYVTDESELCQTEKVEEHPVFMNWKSGMRWRKSTNLVYISNQSIQGGQKEVLGIGISGTPAI